MSRNQAARTPFPWSKSARTSRDRRGATNSEAMPETTKVEISGSRRTALTAPDSHGYRGKKTMYSGRSPGKART
jgi:hypothetical protein